MDFWNVLLVIISIILILIGAFFIIGGSYLIGSDRRLRKLNPLMGTDLRNIDPFLVRIPSRGHIVFVSGIVLVGVGLFLLFR